MSRLHEIERRIDEKLRDLLRSSEAGDRREILEVHRAILDEIASRVDRLPRGRTSFASPQVTVLVLLPAPARRRSYELVFVEAGALERDVRARLEDEHAELPPRFRVAVELVEELPADVAARGFDVLYQGDTKSPVPVEVPAVKLTVIAGTAEQPSYTLSRKRINLGRLSEVLDAKGGVLRRNDVAFTDQQGAPNSTVSRTHAHIEYESESGEFRLFDDRSAYGTTVLRDGQTITVPKGTSKGIALAPGDEILLGQARLRIEAGA